MVYCFEISASCASQSIPVVVLGVLESASGSEIALPDGWVHTGYIYLFHLTHDCCWHRSVFWPENFALRRKFHDEHTL